MSDEALCWLVTFKTNLPLMWLKLEEWWSIFHLEDQIWPVSNKLFRVWFYNLKN